MFDRHAVGRDWPHIMIIYHYFPRDYFVQMCKLLSCFYHSGPEVFILDPVNQITEYHNILNAKRTFNPTNLRFLLY